MVWGYTPKDLSTVPCDGHEALTDTAAFTQRSEHEGKGRHLDGCRRELLENPAIHRPEDSVLEKLPFFMREATRETYKTHR